MLAIGSVWFWFVFKVDVAAEGNSPFNIDLKRILLYVSVSRQSQQ
jgi:hypothetical protein